MSDPCWSAFEESGSVWMSRRTPRARYDAEEATGKEVVIFDLYQGAGEAFLSKEGT